MTHLAWLEKVHGGCWGNTQMQTEHDSAKLPRRRLKCFLEGLANSQKPKQTNKQKTRSFMQRPMSVEMLIQPRLSLCVNSIVISNRREWVENSPSPPPISLSLSLSVADTRSIFLVHHDTPERKTGTNNLQTKRARGVNEGERKGGGNNFPK